MDIGHALVTLENMTSLPEPDWHAYNAAAAGRPARRLVHRAILAAGGDGQGKVALEIGAGGGADALEFARRGWTVHAYDGDDTIAGRLVENSRMDGCIHFHHGDIAQVTAFPVADVIYSAYALPMLGSHLPAVWERLRGALKPGGVLAVDLFGTRDSWADRPDIAVVSDEQIEQMFAGTRIFGREVRDEDGRSIAAGTDARKHWHVITLIARRVA